MKVQTAKKFGFFTALSMTLGSVVGIGIFLKNNSIIKSQTIDAPIGFEDTFSFWSMIISWVISAIISLCAALCFAEICTCRTSKGGLSGWVEQLSNKKFGKVISVSHNTFYYAILAGLLPFLSVEGLYKAIGDGLDATDNIHFGYVFLGGIIILGGLLAVNYLSMKGTAAIQNTSLILKIIPIVLVAIIGLCNANNSIIIDKQPPIENANNSPYPSTQWFSINGMFVAVPAILFSFDSFLNVGVLSTSIKNPHRNVPLVTVFTVLIAAIIYILIAVGAGLTGIGDAGGILKTILPTSDKVGQSALDIVINVFITISAVGVCNSMVASILRSSENLIEKKLIMFANFFHNLSQKKEGLGALVLSIIITFFYIFIFGITATVLNNDAMIDSATNAPMIVFFTVYAITIVLAIKDRYTKKQCQKLKGFMVYALIAIIGISIVIGYTLIYKNIVSIISNPNDPSTAGLFFSNGNKWTITDDAILFWVLIAWLIIFPTINNFVTKKQNLHY